VSLALDHMFLLWVLLVSGWLVSVATFAKETLSKKPKLRRKRNRAARKRRPRIALNELVEEPSF